MKDVEGIVMVYVRALFQPSAPDGRRNAIEHHHLEYSIPEVKFESSYTQKAKPCIDNAN